MNKYILFIVLLLSTSISVQGNSYVNSIGEVITNTASNGANDVTQGFYEPKLTVCQDPIWLMSSNITEVSAELSWTVTSGSSNVEYGVAGFALGSGTQILGTSNTTETLSGLSDGTAYEFYVQSDCEVNKSNWVGPFAFTTVAALPTTQLQALDCNSTVAGLTALVKADAIPGTSNYRFRVINGTDTTIIDRAFRSLPLSLVPVVYATTYSVDVAVTPIGGVQGDYGTACTITTPLPITQLSGAYCGIITTNLNRTVKASGVVGATNYKFRFIEGLDTVIVDRPFRGIQLNNAGLNLVFGKTYSVDVAVYVGTLTGGYGPVCQLTTEFPIVKLGTVYCGMTTYSLTRDIKSTAAPGATNYKFRFIDTVAGGDTLTIDRPFRAMNLNQAGFVGLEYDKTYSIQIAVTLSGIEGDFGPACLFTTVFPDTQLAPLYCNSTANSMISKIFALEAPGATNYRFRFTNGTDIFTVDRSYRNCQLSLIAGLNAGTTYYVDIQVKAAGVTGDYGPVCIVTTPGETAIGINSNQKDLGQEEEIVFETTLSPNPFSDATMLHISSEDASSLVSVSVYDAMGRLIESRLVDLRQETDVRIGTDYNPGFYQVIIVQGDNKKTARIVKQ
ncbi:MAG: T9SS type A sorting domain-containing protein [Crocinitomicaceae bacterium]|nr:T9SS type A sorting domain-containing protein [Crocinitomicaceae bacterium]